ncbi:hypothetical protein EDC96DRAFT_493081 [Choanephora cucurbitarum]|nr:hypothetical protein EDC96DRAFT_493081 [Choanephora cucurbitarum]
MKALLVSLIALGLSSVTTAQYSDEVSVEAVGEYDDFDVGFSEALEGAPPCNGFPEYRKIPVNQAFYVGAHQAGSDAFENGSQTRNILQTLEDGIRLLDINLCKDQEGQLVVCSDSTPSKNTFSNVLEQAFTFARNEVEQFFVLHIKSKDSSADVKEIETVIDQICEIHTNKTQGADEFAAGKCSFIYTYNPEKAPWKSMGEIVNYDPEMAQWEGDGELVGVRTKFMLTLADNVKSTDNYTPSYVTPVFWRSVTNEAGSHEELKQTLHQTCRVPGQGIVLGPLDQQASTPDYLEDALLNKDACNFNDAPLNTYFTAIFVDHYEHQLPYLKEIERRMMDVNYAKWTGNYKTMTPSLFISKKKRVDHDEL